jgi:hypothetical protein
LLVNASWTVPLLCALALAGAFAFVALEPRMNGSQTAVLESLHTAPSAGASTIVPIFMIDVGGTEITQKTRTQGTLKVIEDHDGTLNDLSTRAVSTQSAIAIEIRGATSVVLPKKSYDVELRNDQGDDRKLPLVGLPSDSDWALHGCGHDNTCLRNALAYAVGRELGRYAPRARFIELFLDGKYLGVYLLVERVRRDGHRVDLPRPAGDAKEGDITGGYIFKMDLAEGHPDDPVLRDWVSTVSPMVYSYHYPRFDQITAAQKAYLHGHVAEFEELMMSSRWNDPQRGYRAWIDVPSWVDFALMQELSNNLDAYLKSHYFQKWPASRGNRIALGPLWDFDNAFGGTAVRDGRRTDVWAHRMNRFGAEEVPYNPPGKVPFVPAYWERLWTDPAFHRDVRCRWQMLRAGPLRLQHMVAKIDAWAASLALAQPRDAEAWGKAGNYREQVAGLKAWLSERLTWLDGNLPGSCAAEDGHVSPTRPDADAVRGSSPSVTAREPRVLRP